MNSRLIPLLAMLVAGSGLSIGHAANPKVSNQPAPPRSEPRTASAPDYLLQPQDMLRVQVFQEDDINKQGEVSISQKYTIFLPLIGTINLKGMTAREAESTIRDLYDKDYLVNPQVSVTVTKYAERSVNVFGAVNAAGRIQFPPERGLNILDALSLAGGQSRLADLKKVRLTRNNAAGEPDTVIINVDELIKGGGSEPMQLQPDDAIFVPERIF